MLQQWLQDNILQVVSVCIFLAFAYFHLVERDSGIRLTKKYRNSIFEAQSKIFLNATHYLISGNKDLAIREFLNAVDINRETLDTYFALGDLFRSNGEIEKAISIHRSLIARENISESMRLNALKELAKDFDRGGFIDKAIETYQDVLKVNRDQTEVIHSLCRIYEDVEDWDLAYEYRLMLSKVSQDDQSETISHILVQKAKSNFSKKQFKQCADELDNAFRYAPSVSAQILQIKLQLADGSVEDAKQQMVDFLHEHSVFTAFMFASLGEDIKGFDEKRKSDYFKRAKILKDSFLDFEDQELMTSASVILAKVRLLKEKGETSQAYVKLKNWIEQNPMSQEMVKTEYIRLLIECGETDEALVEVKKFIHTLNSTYARHYCKSCGYNSDSIFWRCPQCREWETIQFRWKV